MHWRLAVTPFHLVVRLSTYSRTSMFLSMELYFNAHKYVYTTGMEKVEKKQRIQFQML